MTEELSTKFNPAEVEAGRYEKWLEQGVLPLQGTKSKTL